MMKTRKKGYIIREHKEIKRELHEPAVQIVESEVKTILCGRKGYRPVGGGEGTKRYFAPT